MGCHDDAGLAGAADMFQSTEIDHMDAILSRIADRARQEYS